MSIEQIKALTTFGSRRNGLNWIDDRPRSPKAMGDWSGLILSQITAQGNTGVQEFPYDLLSNIYICNDMVWTCINLVSSTAALGRLRVKTVNKEDRSIYLPDHPLQKTLDFPNESMTQFDLIQAYVTHQLLFGSVTMLLLRQDMTKDCPVCDGDREANCSHQLFYDSDSPIVQIMPVHPSNLQLEYVPSLGTRCFYYSPNNKESKKYLVHPNNVLTDPFYNPDVAWYGVSPTFLLKRWLDLDASLTRQVTNYFDNGAVPSMVVSLKPGNNYTYEDEPGTLVTKLKENWMNQFGKGRKEPAFTFGDVQIQRIQDNVDEKVGKELYYEIQSHVCATYGVPPTLYEFGLRYGAQRASAEQHERDFYNRTIAKILSRFKSKIEQLVLTSYPDEDLQLVWDLSDMGIASFLVETHQKKIERHWELGLLPRGKAQELLSYEPDQSELGDDYYRLTVMGDGNTEVSNQLDNNFVVKE